MQDHPLDLEALGNEPLRAFQTWFAEAEAAGVQQPEAMSLATANPEGMPSSRMVLFRGVHQDSAVKFFTNYESRKGQELDVNPNAALLFYWREQNRQVRFEGRVERASKKMSEGYFRSRTAESRLGAWASPQSQVIASRAVLIEQLEELAEDFDDEDIPLPPFWGGYLLTPHTVEFWQSREHRLHDRLRMRRKPDDSSGAWTCERLAP